MAATLLLSVYTSWSPPESEHNTKQTAPAPAAPAAAPAAAAPAAGGSGDVVAPMPGTVLRLNVNNGDTVASGDVILILEAMKMENEIVAPCAGKVTLKVTAGETVDTDALLASVE